MQVFYLTVYLGGAVELQKLLIYFGYINYQIYYLQIFSHVMWFVFFKKNNLFTYFWP